MRQTGREEVLLWKKIRQMNRCFEVNYSTSSKDINIGNVNDNI